MACAHRNNAPTTKTTTTRIRAPETRLLLAQSRPSTGLVWAYCGPFVHTHTYHTGLTLGLLRTSCAPQMWLRLTEDGPDVAPCESSVCAM